MAAVSSQVLHPGVIITLNKILSRPAMLFVVRQRHLRNAHHHAFTPRRGSEVFLQGVDTSVYQARSEHGVNVCVL